MTSIVDLASRAGFRRSIRPTGEAGYFPSGYRFVMMRACDDAELSDAEERRHDSAGDDGLDDPGRNERVRATRRAALGPLARRTPGSPICPARRVPVPPVVNRKFTRICRQDYDMRCAETDFMVTSRAAIRLDGPGGGDRSHLVPATVRPGLHPAVNRQRP
jgi:hypothetical protein